MEPEPPDTLLLFYAGLHGGVVCCDMNRAKGVDLLIRVCLTINLGRVPKIHRDTGERGDRPEGVMAIIDRRMCDAMQSSLPQISVGRINFLSVPPTDLLRPSHHHQHQHGGAELGLEW